MISRTIARAVIAAVSTLVSVAPCVALAEEPAKAEVKDPKASFRETGRLGIVGALTEDFWKIGLGFQHEVFEVQAIGHVGFLANDSRETDIRLKLGGRANLGTLNYLAIGGEVGLHPGAKDQGVDTSKQFQLGPYVSLQRYFAATPVMLLLWVNPVQYDHSLSVGASGKAEGQNAIRIFQTGGFGLAYML